MILIMKYPLLMMALLLLFVLSSCKERPIVAEDIDFYETQLFKDVQLAAIYKDSKTFVDLVPKQDAATLEMKYLLKKNAKDFDLNVFVAENFMDKSMKSLEFSTDTTKTMYEHINTMWNKLTRGPDENIPFSSRIALPHKYVVPGGRFQEIYYWDSYFTLEGLLAGNRKDLAKNMVDNFTHLINTIGFIPNGTRGYYRTRSQPPFYGLMVSALTKENEQVLLDYLPALQKEYDFFMDRTNVTDVFTADNHVVNLPSGVLNRYYDSASTPRPEAYKEDLHLATELKSENKEQLFQDLRAAAESGWDFSSRWFNEPGEFSTTKTTHILPIDLNCLLYHVETVLAQAYGIQGETDKTKEYRSKAAQRAKLMQTFFWNDDLGYFMDYNFKKQATTPELTLAGVFPLFFKVATEEQAAKVKKVLLDKFLKPGGLVTTLDHSGQQWDAPNGWAPLQWMAVKGLLAYGYEAEAKDIMERWLALNNKVYKNTGKMMEKYNVEDLSLLSGGGEYETQDGFGWTNGVALGFKVLLEELENKTP